MFRLFFIILSVVSFASAQITEEITTADSATNVSDSVTTEKVESAVNDSTAIPDQPASASVESVNKEVSTDNESKVVVINEYEEKPVMSKDKRERLLSAGQSKRAAGAALTSVGGFFMAFTITYTILFMTDNDQFGIELGSSSSGYSTTTAYLNPGIFGLPVAIPCLVTGIINLAKGGHMVRDANMMNENASLNIQPYFAYNTITKQTNAGVFVNF